MEMSEGGNGFSPTHLLPPIFRTCRNVRRELTRTERNFERDFS